MLAQASAPRKAPRFSPLVKACAQYREYHIAPRSLTGNDWTVINKSGAEYVVDAARQTCTCPAFASRRRRNETTCKHVEAVRLFKAEGAVPALPGVALLVETDEDPFAPPLWDVEERLGLRDEERPKHRTFSAAEKAALLSLWD